MLLLTTKPRFDVKRFNAEARLRGKNRKITSSAILVFDSLFNVAKHLYAVTLLSESHASKKKSTYCVCLNGQQHLAFGQFKTTFCCRNNETRGV